MNLRKTLNAALFLVVLLLVGGALANGVDAFKPSGDMERKDVPEVKKWDLSAFYPSLEKWQESRDHVAREIASIAMCKGRLGKDAAETLICLDKVFGLRQEVSTLESYAFQLWSTDMLDGTAMELKDQASALSSQLAEAAAFVDPELQAVPTGDWNQMVEKQSNLSHYQFHFSDLKRVQKHLLGAAMEGLLALTAPMREGPYTIFNTLTQEMSFPSIKDEQGSEASMGYATFSRYRGSKDRNVRKAAVESFFGTLKKHENTLASSLATSVRGAAFEAKARGYQSSLEQSLDVDAVPLSVYTNLIETTRKNLPGTLHRYVTMRKKLMGLDEIHYYDMYSPLFEDSGQEFQYGQARQLVEESLKPMGADYLTILTQGMTPGSGWTDVYPNKGKKGGAYCNAAYGIHPFVFLNYMNTLDDVFTTAHEFGHAMHFFLSNQAQPYMTADASIFLAEVASTFHEEMLLSYLLSKAQTRKEKLVLLNKRIENIRLTITRQTMFADFEMKLHAELEKTGALTAARLNEIYGEIVRSYFGPDFTFDDHDVIEWAYIPHFYYNFYVYKYSTGLMAAIVFSQRVLAGKPGALEQYKNFLKAGGSDYPLSILNRSGIDFTSPAIVQSTYDLFAKTLDEMEKLLAE